MKLRFSTMLRASTANSKRKVEALDTLRKSWEAGFKDAEWARRDPDLVLLHDDPEFDRLYPEKPAPQPSSGSH